MRRLIVTLLAGPLLVLLAGCAADRPSAEAMAPPPPTLSRPQDLGTLARYLQNLQTVYAQGIDVSNDMDAAELLIEQYVDGELPATEMRRRIADARRRARYGIDEYRTWLFTLPQRPQFRNRQREAGLQAFEDMVRELAEALEAQLLLLDRLMETALAGDERGYTLAGADSLALAATLIDSENTALEAALIAAPADHPQRGIYEASIGGNLAGRAALILIEDSMRDREPRFAEARASIERGLQRAERGIAKGRRDADAMLAEFGDRPALTDSDRISKQFIADLVAAYHRAFDDEARIVTTINGFLGDLLAALEAPEGEASARLMATIQAVEEEFAALTEARLKEQTRRLQLVEAYSAALTTAR